MGCGLGWEIRRRKGIASFVEESALSRKVVIGTAFGDGISCNRGGDRVDGVENVGIGTFCFYVVNGVRLLWEKIMKKTMLFSLLFFGYGL